MPRTTKGTIYRRGKTYWLEYYLAGRRVRVSLQTGDMRKAEQERDRIIKPISLADRTAKLKSVIFDLSDTESQIAQLKDQSRPRLPLADVWSQFPYNQSSSRRGAVRKLTPRNVEENRAAWAKFVGWAGQQHPECVNLEDVTAEIAKEYSKYLQEHLRLTAGRHNKLLTIAGVMCRLAGRPNPFADVVRFQVEHESRSNLEVDELQKVCSAADGELRRLLAIGLYTGMRLGDCVLLQWEHLRKGRIIRVTAKTKKEVSFPVHPSLQAVLDETPPDQRHGYLCPDLAAEYLRCHTLVSKRVRGHLERCGITTVEKAQGRRRGISRRGFHSLRHSFITECARAGVPIGQIREWVGHSSTEITRIYEHWNPTAGQAQILAALPVIEGFSAVPARKGEELKRLRDQVKNLTKTASEGVLRRMLDAAKEG